MHANGKTLKKIKIEAQKVLQIYTQLQDIMLNTWTPVNAWIRFDLLMINIAQYM